MPEVKLLPGMSFRGIVDYLALATGIMLGMSILELPFDNLQAGFRKQSGGN